MKSTDYKKLAKCRDLDHEIADLNLLREKVLRRLGDLGVGLDQDRIVQGSRVDTETLEQELKLLAQRQSETESDLLAQQVTDVLAQAREGSRFVHLQRNLENKPELVRAKHLNKIQAEQEHYQKKQWEIFDYLHKHFSQFEVADLSVTLPDAGRKFFAQVVAVVTQCTDDFGKKSRELKQAIDKKQKKIIKLRRQEQRALEHIHEEVGKNLTDNEIGSPALVKKNQNYQQLLKEINTEEILRTALLNQYNILLDKGITQLTVLTKRLKSITGQNQVTRGILYTLKVQNQVWHTKALKREVQNKLKEFDPVIAELLSEEIDRRYDAGEMGERTRENFAALMDEVLEFQEYLGQVIVDSYQLLTSNLDDLERNRFEYGQCVLDFFWSKS
jgi:hypothetical protein